MINAVKIKFITIIFITGIIAGYIGYNLRDLTIIHRARDLDLIAGPDREFRKQETCISPYWTFKYLFNGSVD